MTLEDFKARMRRLDALSRGLAKELRQCAQGNDPLLYVERKADLKAVRDALAGVESARVVLAKVVQRIEGD